VIFIPELQLAAGTTKSRSGMNSSQREQWRTLRKNVLDSVVLLKVGDARSVCELLERRAEGDARGDDAVELFLKGLGETPPEVVAQRWGDCGETIPLAIMTSLGPGFVFTVTLWSEIVCASHITHSLTPTALRAVVRCAPPATSSYHGRRS
jgi:hypothetical protein